MLERLTGLFRRRTAPALAAPAAAFPASDPVTEAVLREIAAQSGTDPLIGAKIGAKEVLNRLVAGMKDNRGVHIGSLLTVLGSLAGYACQTSVRARAVARGLPEDALFVVINTSDGGRYFFGDELNKALVESRYSVWNLAAGAAQAAGCTKLPDLSELFARVTQSVGGVGFGHPRVPEEHVSGDLPLNYVTAVWPGIFPVARRYAPNPEHWPVLFGLAVQDAIQMARTAIEPGMALRVVMEAAVPMSKVDLAGR